MKCEINERVVSLMESEKNKKNSERNQKALAAAIGVPIGTLSGWLIKDRDIPAKHISAICKFFNVSTDYLLEGNEKKPHWRLGENAKGNMLMNDYFLKPYYKAISWLANQTLYNPMVKNDSEHLSTFGLSQNILKSWSAGDFKNGFNGNQLDFLLENYMKFVGYEIGSMPPGETNDHVALIRINERNRDTDDRRLKNGITNETDGYVARLTNLVRIILREEKFAKEKSDNLKDVIAFDDALDVETNT